MRVSVAKVLTYSDVDTVIREDEGSIGDGEFGVGCHFDDFGTSVTIDLTAVVGRRLSRRVLALFQGYDCLVMC